MFDFLKRLFGRSRRGTGAPSRPAPTAGARPATTPPRRSAPRVQRDVGSETIVYRRQASEAGPGAHAARHGSPAPSGAAVCLVVLSGSRKGYHFPVPTQGAVIGRNQECGLVLSDQHVSGRHAWVGVVDGVAVIRDLGSTNGTFLNAGSQSVGENTPLAIGDTIMLGGHYGLQLRVVSGEQHEHP